MSDLERTWKWHNDAELYANLGGTFRPTSRASEEEWLRQMTAWSTGRRPGNLCKGSGGACWQYLPSVIDWNSRRAELHIFIGEPACRGRGLGDCQTAVRLVDYAFNQLGLRRIYLEVLAENASAIRVYEKCGFKVEGTLRRHVFKDGKFKRSCTAGGGVEI